MKKEIVLICTVFMVFCGCKTVPVENETSDFCGYVIDENNSPIENFVLCVTKGGITQYGITDSKGLFVINDVDTGVFELVGYKNGYASYENKAFKFLRRTDVFCLQVNSADLILDKVEKLISNNELKRAEAVLNEIYCRKNKLLQSVIYEYKKVIGEKGHEKENS